jgi:tRNA modification GTPase
VRSRRALDLGDTIFALASGALPSAVAVVKVSGPLAERTAHALFRPNRGAFRWERAMRWGAVVDERGVPFDEALLLCFPAPHSHTGEPIVEFHLHGSVAVVRRMEEALLAAGLRPAERGEFSYRAFVHGRIAPDALETLEDVFAAVRPEELDGIAERADASFRHRLEGLRDQLVDLQAVLDTAVDFSDEYAAVVQAAHRPIQAVIQAIQRLQTAVSSLGAPENAPEIALLGQPNAGKSSLFNALLCRRRAIVSAEPGTTRDVLEGTLVLGGRRWKLVDTAGIRESISAVEQEGIRQSRELGQRAPIIVLVVDGTVGATEADRDIAALAAAPPIVFWNKRDDARWSPPDGAWASALTGAAATGDGVPALLERLEAHASALPAARSVEAIPSRHQRAALDRAAAALSAMDEHFQQANPAPELLGELNRQALQSMEDLLGPVDSEQVLDRVFSSFCIGK